MHDERKFLARTVAAQGRNLKELSLLVGQNHAYLQQFINRGTPKRLPEHVRVKLSNELRVPEELLRAPADFDRDEPRRLSPEEEWEEEQQFLNAPDDRAYTTINGREYFHPKLPGAIPELDGAVGAGEGKLGEVVQVRVGKETYCGHAVIGEWVMPDTYVANELHASRKTTHIMAVIGDSMEPTYRPGDRVLVDTGQNQIVDDTVFVISDGVSSPKIKRLVEVFLSDPRQVDIVSDNARIAPQRVNLEEITIVGRVVGVVSRR